MSISHCRNFAASCSHDNSIKFYDISDFVKNRNKDGLSIDESMENVKGKNEIDSSDDNEMESESGM